MRKTSKNTKKPESIGGYEVLSYANDGVRILKPKVKPRHFSVAELKRAIKKTCASKSTG